MTSTNQNFIGLLLSLFSVSLLFLVSQPLNVLASVILFGLGHVYIAFYSLLTSKKTLKAVKYATFVSFIFFFSLAYIVLNNFDYIKIYILLSFLYFTTHFFYDEAKMNFGKFNLLEFTGLIALCLIYSAVYLSEFYFSANPILKQYLFYTSIISCILYLLYLTLSFSKKEQEKKDLFSQFIFFSCMYLVGVSFHLSTETISYYYLAGFVIVFHYIRWYIHYYFITTKINRERFLKYFYIVIIFNVFFLALYFFLKENQGPIYKFFYNPIYFYALANAHVTVSFLGEFLGKKSEN